MGVPHLTSGWPARCLCISWSRWWPRAEPSRCTRWRSRCCTPSGKGAAGGRRRTPRLWSSHRASRGDPPLQEEEERWLSVSVSQSTTKTLRSLNEAWSLCSVVLIRYLNSPGHSLNLHSANYTWQTPSFNTQEPTSTVKLKLSNYFYVN